MHCNVYRCYLLYSCAAGVHVVDVITAAREAALPIFQRRWAERERAWAELESAVRVSVERVSAVREWAEQASVERESVEQASASEEGLESAEQASAERG
jgi:hypothetical protein